MPTLIERLEAATGPDRELGNEVLFECGWMLREEGGGPDRITIWIAPDGGEFFDGEQLNPTRSVDAALTLVPNDYEYEIGSEKLIGSFWAIVGNFAAEHKAKSPVQAIALCIAALRARGVE